MTTGLQPRDERILDHIGRHYFTLRAVLDTVGTDPESGHDLVSWAFSPLDASVGL